MMIGMPMADAIAAVGDAIAEGDVLITNDPEATKGMVTHLSDVFLWKPLYHQGRLVCFAWTFIHMSDVGGRVPGSIAPSSTDVYQEGIRVPPRHLFRKGALDQSFLDLFLANTRTPDQNWGDMKACLAALATAERRVTELIRQYGVEHVREGIPAVLDYAEMQARRIIAHVPNGTYRFSDFVEADMVGLGLVRINLALTVKGGELLMDFTGTAPQVRAALNLPSYGRDGHWMLITALCNWLCTLEPSIVYNAGLVRPFKVKIPKGTIINPEPGAAYGARYSTSHKVCDVTIGALAQAVPNELPATDSGQGSILLVSVPNLATGGHKVSVIQPIVGGSGARPTEDGVDGTMVLLNFLKNVPTEVVEREMPEILIRHYGLRPDSGGPGKYRGGTGIVIEFETRVPYTTVTSRSMERYIFPPPGRMGGSAGTTGFTTLNPGRHGGRDIGKIDVLHLEPGDVLRIGTQGGGGFGDPLERPAAIVAGDVRNGFVSIESAACDYGVILSAAGMVDEMATREERARIAKARGWTTVPAFSFGAARERHYALWTDALYDALDREVAHLPPLARGPHYRRIQAEIDRRFATGTAVMPGDIAGIAREIGIPISM
jgi:N-methylhydantoinase B